MHLYRSLPASVELIDYNRSAIHALECAIQQGSTEHGDLQQLIALIQDAGEFSRAQDAAINNMQNKLRRLAQEFERHHSK